jgi:hypothetical protein
VARKASLQAHPRLFGQSQKMYSRKFIRWQPLKSGHTAKANFCLLPLGSKKPKKLRAISSFLLS